MSKTKIEIYGTACIYEWGEASEYIKEAILNGNIDQDLLDEIESDVLSENTETSYLLHLCPYEMLINGEAVEIDESQMMEAFNQPSKFESGDKSSFFVVQRQEVEGLIRIYECDEQFDPSKLVFHAAETSLGDTGEIIAVLDFEYADVEQDFGEAHGFSSMQLIGPNGFTKDIDLDFDEFGEAEQVGLDDQASLACKCESLERAQAVSHWFADWDVGVIEEFSSDSWVVLLTGNKEELECARDVARNNRGELGVIKFELNG